MSPKRKNVEVDVVWIEGKAVEARNLLGMADAKKIDMVDALNRLLGSGVIFGWRAADVADLPNAEAQWHPRRKTISIRRSVLDAANNGDARARFTIAHEIGHAYLKHSGTRNRRADQSKDFGRDASLQEKQANRFAAAFLSPAHVASALNLSSVKDLTRVFGLSAPAADIRLSEMREYRRRSQQEHGDPEVEEESYEVYMRAVLRQAIVCPDR